MHRSAFELAERTVDDEPEIAADVLLGAGAALALERRLQRHALERWERGESSLVND